MIRAFVNFLLDPLVQVLLLFALSGILYWRKRKKGARIAGWTAVGWLLIVSTSPLPTLLVRAKERQYPVYRSVIQDSLPTHVLVLGGGHTVAPSLPANDQLSLRALARLVEGIRIYRQLPNARLVCSGFSQSDRITQAKVQANAALALGVPPTDTLLLPQPHNTAAEARAYADRFGTGQRLILVTGAIHMPRAMYWFRHYGLSPVAAPTDHWVKIDPQYATHTFSPDSNKLTMLHKWLHESVGMLWAKLNT